MQTSRPSALIILLTIAMLLATTTPTLAEKTCQPRAYYRQRQYTVTGDAGRWSSGSAAQAKKAACLVAKNDARAKGIRICKEMDRPWMLDNADSTSCQILERPRTECLEKHEMLRFCMSERKLQNPKESEEERGRQCGKNETEIACPAESMTEYSARITLHGYCKAIEPPPHCFGGPTTPAAALGDAKTKGGASSLSGGQDPAGTHRDRPPDASPSSPDHTTAPSGARPDDTTGNSSHAPDLTSAGEFALGSQSSSSTDAATQNVYSAAARIPGGSGRNPAPLVIIGAPMLALGAYGGYIMVDNAFGGDSDSKSALGPINVLGFIEQSVSIIPMLILGNRLANHGLQASEMPGASFLKGPSSWTGPELQFMYSAGYFGDSIADGSRLNGSMYGYEGRVAARMGMKRLSFSQQQRFGKLSDNLKIEGVHSFELGAGLQLGTGLISPFAELNGRMSLKSNDKGASLDNLFDTAITVGNTFHFTHWVSGGGPWYRTLFVETGYTVPLTGQLDTGFSLLLGYSLIRVPQPFRRLR